MFAFYKGYCPLFPSYLPARSRPERIPGRCRSSAGSCCDEFSSRCRGRFENGSQIVLPLTCHDNFLLAGPLNLSENGVAGKESGILVWVPSMIRPIPRFLVTNRRVPPTTFGVYRTQTGIMLRSYHTVKP